MFNVDLAIFMLNMALILQSASIPSLSLSYTHTLLYTHDEKWEEAKRKSLGSIKMMKFMAICEIDVGFNTKAHH